MGSENIGTITVSASSTLTWSCPTCGSGNFIIDNGVNDASQIAVNGLDQTSGRTVIDAGTYTDVSINTEGQNWTITITSGNSTQTPAPANSPPSSSPKAVGAVNAVNAYWYDISIGRYADAYTWLAPGAISLTQPQFVASEQQAGIRSIRFDGTLLSGSAASATVEVGTLVTDDRQYGCRTWTGTYAMTYNSGGWRIASSDITPHTCTG